MKHMSKNFLPFIDKAPMLGKYFSIKVPTSSLFLGDVAEKFTDNDGDRNLLTKRNGFGKRPIWYLLRPLNVLVPYNYEVSKNANYGRDFSTIDIIEVDYSQVADIIEVHDKIALYPFLNGYESAVISDDRIINEASNEISLFIATIDKKTKTLKYDRPPATNEGADSLFLNMLKSVEIMNEASLDDLKKLNTSSSNFKINTQTPVETRIESYLLGNYVTQRCPLLIGVSAVGKSQLVKNLCKKHGFRLVDIRTSFMSRLDLEGLTEVIYNADGSVESEATGMQEFISCTDEYINFCKQAIPIVEEALAKETDKTKQVNLELTLKKYQEGAKPPVLFLDELTRTEASVRQALTNILSSKTFMGHKMTIARIIGADNHAVDADEDMKDVFNNNDVNDPA